MLKIYLDPNCETIKSHFFDNYKIVVNRLANQLSNKYKVTPAEVIGIVDYYVSLSQK